MHAAPAHAARKRSCPSSAISLQEDWTKVSDLAERRRIQNRIAQRNYRKKLKKRLEDLERHGASSSASPEQKPAEGCRLPTQLPTDSPASPAASYLQVNSASNAPADSMGYFAPPYNTTPIFFGSATSRTPLPLPSQHFSDLECYYILDLDGYAAIDGYSTVQ